ncbi:NB-ARC domain-containing protein [Leptothoe sp. EHU-05/26/07-4]
MRKKILILAANPKDVTRRRLDEEARDIREGLERAKKRDEFEIVQRWAVRPRDLQRAMLDESPQIVHFTGHSEGTAGLVFEDEVGNAKLVTGDALAKLFKLFKQECKCVVLNGCYSLEQAAAIAEHVPYVIGMRRAVKEQAAIEFAVGFYDALGSGRPVEFAFEFGKTAMELQGAGDSDMPVLWPDAFTEVDEPELARSQTGLKLGAPFPRVRLPENYVERPDAMKAVKDMLLAEDERTLVVSAISGLGGLGKSVLATALVLDQEIQARFSDGILWVTLGQNPDLLTMLGDWIRELDKSRESFSANTLAAASRYLGNLLAERRMLLVVDDVWNAAHVEWFRAGGSGCQVLVTTREAVIAGAERYSLDLMTPQEALNLVKGELGTKWTAEMEEPALEFARMVGYLPLAVRLMAVQVARGRKWATLKKAFLKAAKGLQALDYPSVRLKDLSEEEQRKYSLQACFQVSLERLKEDSLEYFERFVWLGILPEDVILQQQMATTLWDAEDWESEETLLTLYERSFLTSGITTSEGEPTYRVHDLMHNMARNLIEQGNLELSVDKQCDLAGNKQQNLTLAHRQLLERYRDTCTNKCWYTLPKDDYIHRHLTWHMEQGDWIDEIHSLMVMSDVKGRNAWFEACDRIGQPAIFVEDLARSWRLTEQSYNQERTRSIELECRYALMTATLNSLIANLPIDIMAEFVKQSFWSVEQAWVYVEQMQNEARIFTAIQVLASYLSKSLFLVAIENAYGIQTEYIRADVLSQLAQQDGGDLDKVLEATLSLQSKYKRVDVLSQLAQQDEAYVKEALEAARQLQNEDRRASILSQLAQRDETYVEEALEAARQLQNEDRRASILSQLAQQDKAYLEEALEAARQLQNKDRRISILSKLAQQDGAYFEEALEAACKLQNKDRLVFVLSELAQQSGANLDKVLEVAHQIQSEYRRASVLSQLAQQDEVYFEEALETARQIQSEYRRASVLSQLAQQNEAYFEEALEAARQIQNEDRRAFVLSQLAQQSGANLDKVLEAARQIQDEDRRAFVLSQLAQQNKAYFEEALETTRQLQNEDNRASILSQLAQQNEAYFEEALEAARQLQNKDSRASILNELAQQSGANLDKVLEAARQIQDEDSRANVLSQLAQQDKAYFEEALEAARQIQNKYSRANVLSQLARQDEAYFEEALEAACQLQDEDRWEKGRADVLSQLAQQDGANLDKVLEAARQIQDEYSRADVLSQLAQQDKAYFEEALKAARQIQDEYSRADVLSQLAQQDKAYFEEALETARQIQNKYSRANVLNELAQQSGANLDKVLEAARQLQDEDSRAFVLSQLAQQDKAYFEEALETARQIQSENSRASILNELAQQSGANLDKVLEAARQIQDEDRRADILSQLAQQDEAYFEEALEAARQIQSEDSRANVLSQLAQQDEAYFEEALEAARQIQSENRRADILSQLAQQVPNDRLLNLKTAITDITHKPTAAKALSNSLVHFPLANLSYTNWKSFLHLLAYRKRSYLMQDLVTLYPAIIHLGGEEAMRGVVDAMKDVCSQWR